PENTFTILALRLTDLLVPHPLLDLDRASIEVHVLPFEPQHFRDPRAGGDAGLDDEEVRLLELSQHARRLVEGEYAALVLVALLAELRLAGRATATFLPSNRGSHRRRSRRRLDEPTNRRTNGLAPLIGQR